MAVGTDRRGPSLFSRPLVVAGIVVFVGLWIMLVAEAGNDAYSWLMLRTRGVDTTGIVESRTVKHCYGLACSSPTYFTGAADSEDYRAFVDRCWRNACQWFVAAEYHDRVGRRRLTQLVETKDYKALAPYRKVPIRFDPWDRDRAIIVGRTVMSSGSIAVVSVAGFVTAWVLFMTFMIRADRVRRRHQRDGRYWGGY